MEYNADFSRRVVIRPEDYQWVSSPVPGVERMMFDRVGEEVARATSLVRYAPNSEFPSHTHGGGEEILVLEGAFADEHGEYPEGTYLRNPIGSSHHPRVGAAGSLIFVKLYQHSRKERSRTMINTTEVEWQPGAVTGQQIKYLHELEGECVTLMQWSPLTRFPRRTYPGGGEIFVLEGGFHDEYGSYPKGSWIRSPRGSGHTPYTGEDGAQIYLKTGHL